MRCVLCDIEFFQLVFVHRWRGQDQYPGVLSNCRRVLDDFLQIFFVGLHWDVLVVSRDSRIICSEKYCLERSESCLLLSASRVSYHKPNSSRLWFGEELGKDLDRMRGGITAMQESVHTSTQDASFQHIPKPAIDHVQAAVVGCGELVSAIHSSRRMPYRQGNLTILKSRLETEPHTLI